MPLAADPIDKPKLLRSYVCLAPTCCHNGPFLAVLLWYGSRAKTAVMSGLTLCSVLRSVPFSEVSLLKARYMGPVWAKEKVRVLCCIYGLDGLLGAKSPILWDLWTVGGGAFALLGARWAFLPLC